MDKETAKKASIREDEKLLARFRAGDESAFGELVEKYQRRVFAVVYRMLSRVEDAEDLVQDAFVQAYRYLDNFEGRSAFSTWLFQIAINRTLNFRRRQSLATFQGLPRPDAMPASSSPGPEAPVAAAEIENRLQAAVDGLPDNQRTVFVLRETEKMSYKDMSLALGVPVGTVMSRLARAREALQNEMKEFL